MESVTKNGTIKRQLSEGHKQRNDEDTTKKLAVSCTLLVVEILSTGGKQQYNDADDATDAATVGAGDSLEPVQQDVVLEEVVPYTQLNLPRLVLRILDKLNALPHGMTGTDQDKQHKVSAVFMANLNQG